MKSHSIWISSHHPFNEKYIVQFFFQFVGQPCYVHIYNNLITIIIYGWFKIYDRFDCGHSHMYGDIVLILPTIDL